MDIKIGDKVTYKEPNSYFKEKVFSLIINNEGDIEIFAAGIKKAKNEADYIEIIKIERPNYEIVEEKKELLTDEERIFLKYFIKFNGFKIHFIKKEGVHLFFANNFNDVVFNNLGNKSYYYCNNFKGLEMNKIYSLEELGLEDN